MEIKKIKNSKFKNSNSLKTVFFNKKGFAFSFLVFFLAMVMFAFLNLEMFKDEYTKDSIFIESRVNYLSEEISYFKSTYMKNVVSYSLYNTLNSLSNYSRDSANFAQLNQNYSKFNDLVFEGMINGSFDGNIQNDLVGISDGRNKTLTQFFDEYKASFNDNYKANLTLDIVDINVFEEKPYYVTIQLLINWSVKTQDNISSWGLLENVFVTVQIFDLPVPEFLYYEDTIIPSRSVEYNLADQNWSLSNFQKTINESYSTIFVEKKHKYSIGKSYIKRFLNISQGSYDEVLGFWSFDYDDYEREIYDSALNNKYSKHYGNSVGIYGFDNDSIFANNISDFTDYNNSGVLNNGVNCTNLGVYKNSCFFDGANDNIEIYDFPAIKKEISVFAWINVNTTTTQNSQRIVCAKDEYFCYFVNNDGSIGVRLNTSSETGVATEILFPVNLSFNEWHNVGFTYDGNITLLYIDGIRHLVQGGVEDSLKYTGDLGGSRGSLFIGQGSISINPFEGLIDEVGIFTRVLSMKEIANLYNERKIYDIDHMPSFYGKEIYFDGEDDYINLGNDSIYNFNNQEITIEAWVKLNNISGNYMLIDKGVIGGGGGNGGYGVYISNGVIYFGFHGGATSRTLNNVINKTDYLYHIVVMGGDRSEPDRFYVNGINYSVTNNGNWVTTRLSDYNLTIGKSSDTNSNYFDGFIDEIKIYNRSLSVQEIRNNYNGYSSFGKGCCNYILLMNPNKFGYNNLVNKENISYSTKLFYDYQTTGFKPNISLYNLTNVTTFDINENYYNFLYDDCVNYAFTTVDYQNGNNSIRVDYHKSNGIDNGSCSNLVKLGIY